MSNFDSHYSGTILSIVVPVYNEDQETLVSLSRVLEKQTAEEKIIVDASACVDSATFENVVGLQILHSTVPGRGRQMNLGALAASGRWLFFLHADSRPAVDVRTVLPIHSGCNTWGRFDVQLSVSVFMFRMVAHFMNVRSYVTGICTGDQGLLVRRDDFEALGGFKHQVLMEDIDFSSRCKGRPLRLRPPLVTSARRWQVNGLFRTILLMWRLRFLYWLAVSPWVLKRHYRDHGSEEDGT